MTDLFTHLAMYKFCYYGLVIIAIVLSRIYHHIKTVEKEREARNGKGIGGWLKRINSKYGRDK